jgi:hypothetical protein
MAGEFSKSLPFLLKPKNLDSLTAVNKQLRMCFLDKCPAQANEDFDPFGFAETFDVKWLQEAELKHARIAMLATVGWLVQVMSSCLSPKLLLLLDSRITAVGGRAPAKP